MNIPKWSYVPCICSFGGDFGIAFGALTTGSTPATAVYPASNDAIFVPFTLYEPTLIKRLYCANGTAVSGNIDVGIYADDGTRITSSGSTTQTGTSALQFFDITDIVIGPGRFYLAVAMDNTTGALFRSNISAAKIKAAGVAKMASAFPLPASVTFATADAAYTPLIGAEVVRVL